MAKYPWKRFWAPRGVQSALGDGGYLSDPDGPAGQILNPRLTTLAGLEDITWLALLGEPGIGKSTELWVEKERLAALVAPADEVRLVDLAGISTGAELRDAVAPPSGRGRLWLLLDGLDECLLDLKQAAHIIADRLKLAAAQLRLRIACQPALWPEWLGGSLGEIWPAAEAGHIYSLVPLRRQDVRTAAAARGLDSGAFLAAVHEARAEPFAIKPHTLNLLIAMFLRGESLSANQREIYSRGCAALCEDAAIRDGTPARVGRLTPQQRCGVAARVATLMLLGNRDAVYLGPAADAAPRDLVIDEALGGREEAGGVRVGVDELRESLNTGLFADRGAFRRGWTHRNYAEFLAARWLAGSGLSAKQSIALLTHQGPPPGRIVPQLSGIAAWLAATDDAVFDHVLEHEPRLLVTSDTLLADPPSRRRVVAAILELAAAGTGEPIGWEDIACLDKLDHPGLAEQLKPYVAKPAAPAARWLAALLAWRCKVGELAPKLAAIALDPAEQIGLREVAAQLVASAGDAESKQALLPLLESVPEDHRDELKGCALSALWPDQLGSHQLLAALSPPRAIVIGGSYDTFLRGLRGLLGTVDLQQALRWASKQDHLNALATSLAELVSEVIRRGWQHLAEPGVLPALAAALLERARLGLEAASGSVAAPFTDRYAVLRSCLESGAGRDANVYYSVRAAQLTLGDLREILAVALAAPPRLKAQLVGVIRYLGPFDAEVLDLLYAAGQQDEFLRTEFSGLLGPISLDSEIANAQRAAHRHETAALARRTEREGEARQTQQKISDGIASCLQRVEAGDLDAWWQLNFWLAATPNGHVYEHEPDLRRLTGWRSLTDTQKAGLVPAATAYLLDARPDLSAPPQPPTGRYRPAAAGYRALRLLVAQAPECLARLSAGTWERWAPAIFEHTPSEGEPGEDNALEVLIGVVRAAPHVLAPALRRLLSDPDRRFQAKFVLRRSGAFWGPATEQALLDLAGDPDLPYDGLVEALSALLQAGSEAGADLAERMVRDRAADPDRRPAVAAARAHLRALDDARWVAIWAAVEQHEEFGRQLLEAACEANELAPIETLEPRCRASACAWLIPRYPHHDHGATAHYLTTADRLAMLWNQLLSGLVAGGHDTELDSLAARLPQHPWLSGLAQSARTERLITTWAPTEPAVVLQLAADTHRRLVRGPDELIASTLDVLEALQADLHGCYALAQFVADKDEPAISAFVAHELELRLARAAVVVNREVQILYNQNRTDIQVEATAKTSGGSVLPAALTIEAKGCWNPELSTAMHSQLVDTYLKQAGRTHGLYLVYWVAERKGKASAPAAELRLALEEQAAQLSKGGITVRSFVLNVDPQSPTGGAMGRGAAQPAQRKHRPGARGKKRPARRALEAAASAPNPPRRARRPPPVRTRNSR